MTPDDFPKLLASLQSRHHYGEVFKRSVIDVQTALEVGQIPNARWNEVKESLNRALEEAFEVLVRNPHFYSRHGELPEEILDLCFASGPQLHNLSAWDKRMAKFTLDHPAAHAIRAFLDEARPLGEAAVSLKDKVVKRVVKPVEEQEERFVPKQASSASLQLVRSALEAITHDAYEALREAHVHELTRLLNRYMTAQAASKERLSPFEFYMHRDNLDSAGYDICSKCTKQKGPTLSARYELVPNFDALIRDQAERFARKIQNSFVNKNLAKLASIVDAKRNLASVERVGYHISLEGLRGTLRLTFDDGARCDAQNSVVLSRSSRGKRFLRFPLTFHNVRMPDGAAMKQPSEEKMNNEFAGRYYGTIQAPASERSMLVSFGLSLGPYDSKNGRFPAEASWEAKQRLEEFSRDFVSELHQRAFKPHDEMTNDELRNELKWCEWIEQTGSPAQLREAKEIQARVQEILDKAAQKNAFANARASRTAESNESEPL
ncbi:hypothetical protein [Ralstonia sp. ASV6]|uniref:hypothetical protein n=1 Tax=Ralstonia sp. ASV6 TaxID=2795124 RepID=UPI0018EBB299|nr:hypothetical protein [Ralstonia sp. ASV6]